MPDPQNKINALVERFVSDVSAVVRDSAIEALQRGMAATESPSTAPIPRPARSARPPAARQHRAPGAKRSQEEIDAVAKRLQAHIEAHPGQRVEEINRALGTSTDDVMLPLAKLLAQRSITKTGQRRGTKYFAAGTGAKAHAVKTGARAKRASRSKPARAKRRTSRRSRR